MAELLEIKDNKNLNVAIPKGQIVAIMQRPNSHWAPDGNNPVLVRCVDNIDIESNDKYNEIISKYNALTVSEIG